MMNCPLINVVYKLLYEAFASFFYGHMSFGERGIVISSHHIAPPGEGKGARMFFLVPAL